MVLTWGLPSLPEVLRKTAGQQTARSTSTRVTGCRSWTGLARGQCHHSPGDWFGMTRQRPGHPLDGSTTDDGCFGFGLVSCLASFPTHHLSIITLRLSHTCPLPHPSSIPSCFLSLSLSRATDCWPTESTVAALTVNKQVAALTINNHCPSAHHLPVTCLSKRKPIHILPVEARAEREAPFGLSKREAAFSLSKREAFVKREAFI